MKKIIGTLGIGAVALALFFNTNLKNANATSIVAFNIANAEITNEDQATGCRYTGNIDDSCILWFSVRPGCVNNVKAKDCSV